MNLTEFLLTAGLVVSLSGAITAFRFILYRIDKKEKEVNEEVLAK